MSGCGCEVEIKDQSQRQVLYWLLGINATMFVIEMGIGLLADSTALIADSLDMLADAVVYGVALYAIGKSLLHKANAARISGFFQMALGVLIIIDIVIIKQVQNCSRIWKFRRLPKTSPSLVKI